MSFLRRYSARTIALAASFLIAGFSDPLSAQQLHDGVEVLRSSQSELVVRYTPVFKGFDSVQVQGKWLYTPRVSGAFLKSTEPGAPSELVFPLDITVPSPSGFSVTSVEAHDVQRFFKEILPVANPYSEVKHTVTARANSLKTAPWAEAEYKGIARTRHIGSINLTAARYDAAFKTIEIPGSVTVRVAFHGVSKVAAAPKSYSEDFKTTINHDETVQWRIDAQPSLKTIMSASSPKRVLSSGTWYKLTVETDGIYKLDASALAAAGISIPASEVHSIKVFGKGGKELSEKVSDALGNEFNEQPVIIRTKSNGDLDAIIFYGSAAKGFDYQDMDFKHFINHYTFKNSYFLTWGGSAGKRAVEKDLPTGEVRNSPMHFTGRVFHEDEMNSPYRIPSGRRWFGTSVDNALPMTFTTPLPGLLRNGVVKYRVNVAHRSKYDGSITVFENNQSLVKVNLNGSANNEYFDAYSSSDEASLSSQQIASDGRSVLKFSYNGNSTGTGYIDWFEIHYPRQLQAENGELELFSNSGLSGITEYVVNGFSGETVGFDVTDRANPVLLKNAATTGGMFAVRENLDGTSPKRYFIASSFKTPQLQKITLAGLREQNITTDALLITHPDFMQSAKEYKKYREAQGELSVNIVSVVDIFNEYGYGAPDPTAIRDFLAHAFQKSANKLSYVILWGDGHLDARNITTQRTSYIPPYESLDKDGGWYSTETYSTDDYFGRIVGNDATPDLAIGRIPINTNGEGESMVGKIKHYEQNSSKDPWRTMVTLVADDGATSQGSDGAVHTNQSEWLSSGYIPGSMQQNKIYLVEFPTDNSPVGRRKPLVSEKLLNSVNTSGTLILNWVGHGNPRLWAHEAIFEKETSIPLMTNIDKQFFLTAATCDFGRFDQTENQSGAEELLLSKKGGAIGVFSATRVVYSGDNAEINQAFYNRLFSMNGRIGDAYFAVKQVRTNSNDEKYFLLGDPTLRLLIPEGHVRIEEINGVNVSTDTVSLKALSTVNITGSVLKTDSTLNESFNGTVVINLFDSDIKIVLTEEGASGTFHILKTGGALNKGAFKVNNGKFTASFTIPKDISFMNSAGRLYAYAFSDNNQFAKGSSRAFKVNGVESVTSIDNIGPKIDLYLDGRTFKAGNMVRRSPLLIADIYDETGINTTGAGVGHNIEMWIDGNLRSENLTQLFSTSLEDVRKGSVEKQLFNLTPGHHTIRFRAWDVFNNYSEAETHFIVAESDDRMIASQVGNYPNPFSDRTCFTFQHNQASAFSANIRIFTATGRLVRTLTSEISTSHTGEVCWDGLDETGNSVSGGSYVFNATLLSENGTVQESTGNIIFIR